MRTPYLLLAAISLVLTLTVAAENDMSNSADADTRELVAFPLPIKQAMLMRMRRNLADIQRIQQALAEGNFEAAADVAEYSLGLSSLGPHNARQAPFMPEPMQQMGMQMHAASSRLARTAQEADLEKSLAGLAELTAYCVACHAAYGAK